MADEGSTQAAEGAQTPAPTTETTQTTAQITQTAGGEQASAPVVGKMYSEADVEQLVRDRLKRQEQKFHADAAKAQQDAERKAAEDQGKYRELYEGLQRQLTEEQAARAALERAALQREAAEAVGLPAKFAERLRGESLDEMKTDAKELLAAMPKPAAPNINATGSNGAPSTPFSEEDRVRLAHIFGVSPKNFGRPGQ